MNLQGNRPFGRPAAGLLAIMLILPLPDAGAQQPPQNPGQQPPAPQTAPSTSQTPTAAQPEDRSGQLPDSPQPAQNQTGVQQQNENGAPLGTAAAPAEKPSGIAASRPAGAAIAPAKQRRVRSIFIKVGLVVGAGVAIGTVAALSHSSPSHPQ